MRYKLILLLVLVFCGQVLATTSPVYVRTDGHDSGTGAENTTNASTGAFLTINYARQHVSFPAEIRIQIGDYNEANIAIYNAAHKAYYFVGWNNTVKNTDANLVVWRCSHATDVFEETSPFDDCNIEALTMRSNAPSPNQLIYTSDSNLTITNCILGSGSDVAPAVSLISLATKTAPDRFLTVTNSALNGERILSGLGLESFTFTGNDCNITGASTTAGAIWMAGAQGPMIISNNIFRDTSAKATLYLEPTGTRAQMPDVNISGNSFTFVKQAIYDYNAMALTINNNHFKQSTAGTAATIQTDTTSTCPNIRITNNIFEPNSTGSTVCFDYTVNTAPDLNNVIITGNSFTADSNGIAVQIGGTKNLGSNVFLANNTVNSAMPTNGAYAFCIGLDGGYTDPIGGVVIRNNTVQCTGAGRTSHAILVGNNVKIGEVSYNNISGGNYQLVIKGQTITAHHNILNGPKTLLLKGAAYCNVFNNTCYATGGTGSYALGLSQQNNTGAGIYYQHHNQIYDNIFDAGNAAYVIGTDADLYGIYGVSDDYINNNCYVNGTSGFARLELTTNTATVIPDLATMKTTWLMWTNHGVVNFPLNDTNSISIDPKFKNVDSNDFSLLGNSPCINAGTPTPNGGKTTIGAWQPKKQNGSVILGK
jgi:hypothetical protein